METLFVKTTFNHSISLEPVDINNKIEDTILKKLKNELECICIKHGYVKKDSIKILNRSLGSVAASHFTGNIIYNVTLSADICNPLENSVIDAKILNINKMGVLAAAGEGNPPSLSILLAKQHHINNNAFDSLHIGKTIKVKVIGKRFEYGDNQISIIALLDSQEKPTVNEPENEEPVLTGSKETIYFNNKDNKWLSSSYVNRFTYNNKLYDTVEHAFQAQKVKDTPEYSDNLVADSDKYIGNKASLAKSYGSNSGLKTMGYNLRDDWDSIKRKLLKDIVREFFSGSQSLTEKLIQTNSSNLVYKGGKADKYFGVNKNNDGENQYGKVLMEIRDELKVPN